MPFSSATDEQNAKKMIRTYSYTASLSAQVHKQLAVFLEQQRQLYNGALQERIEAYQKKGLTITHYDQLKSLTQIRSELPEFSEFQLASQRSCLRHLEQAFQGFFRRVRQQEKAGFPRFKSKHRGIRSFETEQFAIRDSGRWHSVRIKGIGRIRFKGEIKGQVKRIRVVRSAQRVTVQLVCECEQPSVLDLRPPLGIDVGITQRLSLSDGFQVSGRVLDRTVLRHRQRKLSKALKGSNSRAKKRRMLAKQWQRTTARENGYLHELTSKLVQEKSNKFVIEDLQIQNMVKNRNLSKAIMAQNWAKFAEMLTYKAESAGGWVIRVPAHHTSQTCSRCGTRKPMPLSQRVYRCLNCGFVEDRDVNASKNILQRGIESLSGGDIPDAWGEGSIQDGTARSDYAEQYREVPRHYSI